MMSSFVGEHQVGPIARRDPTKLTAQAQELRWILTGHAHGLGQIETQQLDRVPHGRCHVEVGAGQRAVLVDEHAVRDGDHATLQRERLFGCADAWHSIRHQHESVVPLAAQGDAQHGRVDMAAVHDDAAPAVRVVERGADDSGFAPGEL